MVENIVAVGKLHAHNLFLNENRAYVGPKMYPSFPRLLPSMEARRYRAEQHIDSHTWRVFSVTPS